MIGFEDFVCSCSYCPDCVGTNNDLGVEGVPTLTTSWNSMSQKQAGSVAEVIHDVIHNKNLWAYLGVDAFRDPEEYPVITSMEVHIEGMEGLISPTRDLEFISLQEAYDSGITVGTSENPVRLSPRYLTDAVVETDRTSLETELTTLRKEYDAACDAITKGLGLRAVSLEENTQPTTVSVPAGSTFQVGTSMVIKATGAGNTLPVTITGGLVVDNLLVLGDLVVEGTLTTISSSHYGDSFTKTEIAEAFLSESRGTPDDIPYVVLTPETDIAIEALKALVYDAKDQLHENTGMWVAKLAEFKQWAKDND